MIAPLVLVASIAALASFQLGAPLLSVLFVEVVLVLALRGYMRLRVRKPSR